MKALRTKMTLQHRINLMYDLLKGFKKYTPEFLRTKNHLNALTLQLAKKEGLNQEFDKITFVDKRHLEKKEFEFKQFFELDEDQRKLFLIQKSQLNEKNNK